MIGLITKRNITELIGNTLSVVFMHSLNLSTVLFGTKNAAINSI